MYLISSRFVILVIFDRESKLALCHLDRLDLLFPSHKENIHGTRFLPILQSRNALPLLVSALVTHPPNIRHTHDVEARNTVHSIRHAVNTTVWRLANFVAVLLFFVFVQIILYNSRKAEPQTFNVKLIFQMKYVIFNHIFEKVYPPVRSMSSEEGPPCLYTLIRR